MHVLIPAVSRFTQLTGICRYAVNHAKAVADVAQVSQVTLLAGRWQMNYFRDYLGGPNPKIRIVPAKCHKNSVSRNLWYAYQLPSIAKRLGADLVHLSYPVPVRHSRFSVPLLATVHDLYPFEHPENFGFPGVLFNRVFLRRCMSEIDAVVCVSEETRERLARYCGECVPGKTIATIYSYSELELSQATRPAKLPFNRFILAVGQHRKNKNHGLLLRAYQKLISSNAIGPQIGLVIAGATGPETPALKSLVETLGIEDQVQLLSGVSDNALAWLYRNCETFVAASSIEGFCLPLLEAMQLCRRVLCSDIAVFREVTNGRSNFFSLHGSSADALAHAIERVLKTPEHSPGTVDARFSRKAASNAYERIYLLTACGAKETLARSAS